MIRFEMEVILHGGEEQAEHKFELIAQVLEQVIALLPMERNAGEFDAVDCVGERLSGGFAIKKIDKDTPATNNHELPVLSTNN